MAAMQSAEAALAPGKPASDEVMEGSEWGVGGVWYRGTAGQRAVRVVSQ